MFHVLSNSVMYGITDIILFSFFHIYQMIHWKSTNFKKKNFLFSFKHDSHILHLEKMPWCKKFIAQIHQTSCWPLSPFFSAKAYTFTNIRSSSITAIQAVILLEYSHTSEVYLHWCCSIFYPGSLNQTISKDIKMYAIQP